MKKIILHFSFVSLLFISSINAKNTEPIKYITNYAQEQSFEAYLFYQGTWHKGFIMLSNTENGYNLTRYQFSDVYVMNRELTGYFNGYEKFTKLNPNNELAIRNNFTHYVNLQGLTAYIISN